MEGNGWALEALGVEGAIGKDLELISYESTPFVGDPRPGPQDETMRSCPPTGPAGWVCCPSVISMSTPAEPTLLCLGEASIGLRRLGEGEPGPKMLREGPERSSSGIDGEVGVALLTTTGVLLRLREGNKDDAPVRPELSLSGGIKPLRDERAPLKTLFLEGGGESEIGDAGGGSATGDIVGTVANQALTPSDDTN